MNEEINLESAEITELQDEILKKILKIMKEMEIKEPTKDKEIASLVEDSLDTMELRLALENGFSDSQKSLVINEIDLKNIMKMTVTDLAVYINQKLYSE